MLQTGSSRVRLPEVSLRIFHWPNPSGRTVALGSTQPVTEMSTRNISLRVKAAGVYDWQPYHLHVPIFLKSGSLNLLEPSGPVQGCNWIALPLPLAWVLGYRYGYNSGISFSFYILLTLTSEDSPAASVLPSCVCSICVALKAVLCYLHY